MASGEKHPAARTVSVVLSALFLTAVAWLLARELRDLDLDALLTALGDISARAIATGIALAAASYAVLSTYDLLAVRHLGRRLPYSRVAPASFVSYACNFNLGAIVGGAASRYRTYGAWGVDAPTVTAITVFCVLTSWLGFAAVASLLLLVGPDVIEPSLLPIASTRVLGTLAALPPLAYLALCAWRRALITVWKWTYALPGIGLAALQIGVSSVQWLLPSAVIWMLQPGDGMPYPLILGAHLLAAVAGLIVRVPGSLGVIEAVFLRSFAGVVSHETVLATLLAFRGVYFLLPLALASATFLALEVHRRRAGTRGRARPRRQARTATS